MPDWVWVAAGGALGAWTRWSVIVFCGQFSAFPWGTLVVNALGCGLVGSLMGAGFLQPNSPAAWRLGVASGFLGSLTTFSAFGLDTWKLGQENGVFAAIGNVSATLITTAVALVAGWGLGKWWAG